jgi:hypothetical protein
MKKELPKLNELLNNEINHIGHLDNLLNNNNNFLNILKDYKSEHNGNVDESLLKNTDDEIINNYFNEDKNKKRYNDNDTIKNLFKNIFKNFLPELKNNIKKLFNIGYDEFFLDYFYGDLISCKNNKCNLSKYIVGPKSMNKIQYTNIDRNIYNTIINLITNNKEYFKHNLLENKIFLDSIDKYKKYNSFDNNNLIYVIDAVLYNIISTKKIFNIIFSYYQQGILDMLNLSYGNTVNNLQFDLSIAYDLDIIYEYAKEQNSKITTNQNGASYIKKYIKYKFTKK